MKNRYLLIEMFFSHEGITKKRYPYPGLWRYPDTFHPRLAKDRWDRYFVSFTPAISDKAAKSIRCTIRSWRIHLMSDESIVELSRIFNPILRGWINYYGNYYRSELYPIFDQLNCSLRKWVMRKYKKLRGKQRRAGHWLGRIARRQPYLFAHWRFGARPAAGR